MPEERAEAAPAKRGVQTSTEVAGVQKEPHEDAEEPVAAPASSVQPSVSRMTLRSGRTMVTGQDADAVTSVRRRPEPATSAHTRRSGRATSEKSRKR